MNSISPPLNLFSTICAISIITVFTASLIKHYYFWYALSIVNNQFAFNLGANGERCINFLEASPFRPVL